MSSFLTFYLNELLPQHLSVRLQNSSVQLTRCDLRKVVLFVTLRQRAWPWRAVKVRHFEFSRIFFQCLFFPMFGNQLLPGHFVRLASKFVSTVRRWCWTNSVLFCDSTSKGVAMACRQSWFRGLFFQSLWTKSPQGIYQFCFKIGQYSQKMVLNKRCALCDSTSKGVAVACHQSDHFLQFCTIP